MLTTDGPTGTERTYRAGVSGKCETKTGLANEFRTVEEPGDGEIELPDLDDPFASDEGEAADSTTRGQPPGDPADSSLGVSSTGFVWVVGVGSGGEGRRRSGRATLPAPEGTDPAGLPG